MKVSYIERMAECEDAPSSSNDKTGLPGTSFFDLFYKYHDWELQL